MNYYAFNNDTNNDNDTNNEFTNLNCLKLTLLLYFQSPFFYLLNRVYELKQAKMRYPKLVYLPFSYNCITFFRNLKPNKQRTKRWNLGRKKIHICC